MKLVDLNSDYHFIRGELDRRGWGYWLQKTTKGFALTFILTRKRRASIRMVFKFNSKGRMLKVTCAHTI